jgi:lycopene cyclase domain-containing protein
MTYLSFLAVFLVLPLLAFAALALRDLRGRRLRLASRAVRPAIIALLVHVVLAVVYTTPWDNYLVATRVWWYDPARVLGLTLGWVPLEEYLFFVLQPLLAGLVLFALARRLSLPRFRPNLRLRLAALLTVGAVWLAAVAMLASGWDPGTYLGLELAWALPPIALQLIVGADVLWRHRRRVAAAVLGLTLYLGAADFLAIGAGVWTIDPAQSLNFFLGGELPVEELVFFLLTNTLVICGLTLSLDPVTWQRWVQLRASLRQRAPRLENA